MLKEGERRYHLDGYDPDGSHVSFENFTNNPGYAATKKLVCEIVEGRRKPVSGWYPANDGGEDLKD